MENLEAIAMRYKTLSAVSSDMLARTGDIEETTMFVLRYTKILGSVSVLIWLS